MWSGPCLPTPSWPQQQAVSRKPRWHRPHKRPAGVGCEAQLALGLFRQGKHANKGSPHQLKYNLWRQRKVLQRSDSWRQAPGVQGFQELGSLRVEGAQAFRLQGSTCLLVKPFSAQTGGQVSRFLWGQRPRVARGLATGFLQTHAFPVKPPLQMIKGIGRRSPAVFSPTTRRHNIIWGTIRNSVQDRSSLRWATVAKARVKACCQACQARPGTCRKVGVCSAWMVASVGWLQALAKQPRPQHQECRGPLRPLELRGGKVDGPRVYRRR